MNGTRRLRRGRELQRSLTLLHVFLLASAVVCATGHTAAPRSLEAATEDVSPETFAPDAGGVLVPA